MCKISMNCVSCVVIFLSLRTNTENASVQHNEHRWYQCSNALFGNSANNFIEPFSWCKTFINSRSSLLIRLPCCFCLCKNYVNADAQCAGVEVRLQWDTNRKWHMTDRLVTWPMTTRDLERSRSWPKYKKMTIISKTVGDRDSFTIEHP